MDSGDLQLVLDAQALRAEASMATLGNIIAKAMTDSRDADKKAQDANAALHKTEMTLLQDKLDKTNEALLGVMQSLAKDRDPAGLARATVLEPKDFPRVSEFKHAAVTDGGSQADFIVAFAQIANHMELHGKHCGDKNVKTLHSSDLGRAQIKLHITDKFTEARRPEELEKAKKAYSEEIQKVFNDSIMIDKADVEKPTEWVSGREPSVSIFRPGGEPFDSLLYRHHADESLYAIIVATFTHQDWQLRFRQVDQKGHGAACMQLVCNEFDPKDLASAVLAAYNFLTSSYTSTSMEQHCTDMRSKYIGIKAMYFDRVKRQPDWERMAKELCATAFLRSLPDDLCRQLQDEVAKEPRDKYTFERCVEIALRQRQNAKLGGIAEPQFAAFAQPLFTPETFSAFLAGSGGLPPGTMCWNCGVLNDHRRAECPKPCRVPLPGGRSGDCNGVAPMHKPLCGLNPVNVQARRDAAKQARESQRTNRRNVTAPPAYARQRTRRFTPQMRQQAQANLTKLGGLKAQVLESLLASAEPARSNFLQEQMASVDSQMAQANLVLQQADEEQAMLASAEVLDDFAEVDPDFDELGAHATTDACDSTLNTTQSESSALRVNATSAWFVPEPPRKRMGARTAAMLKSGVAQVMLAASLLSLASSASAYVAAPPLQAFSNGRMQTFDGGRAMHAISKACFTKTGSRYFPGLPTSAVVKSCIVDSGCAIHMFADSNQLSHIRPSNVMLQTADKSQHPVAYEGNGVLQAVDRCGAPKTIAIGRTLHTPSMHNLLSCSGIVNDGGVVHLSKDGSYIKLRDNSVFNVHQRGRLFYLDYIDPQHAMKPRTTVQGSVRPPHGLPRAGKVGGVAFAAESSYAPTPAPEPPFTVHADATHDDCTVDGAAAFSTADKQVTSGRVHGVATETRATEVVDVTGAPVFDTPTLPQSLWHRRCAHADSDRINASIPITHGLHRVHTNKFCPCCVYSKQASRRVPTAPVVRKSAHEPLSQVSVDLTQFSHPSMRGAKYLIVFVDTYSRYTWVQALENKSQAPKALRQFIQQVGCPREILSDWGTEFFGQFSQVCIDNYIRQVRSAPYSPFSNGIVERKNRELKSMI
jgi:hypothetical protein